MAKKAAKKEPAPRAPKKKPVKGDTNWRGVKTKKSQLGPAQADYLAGEMKALAKRLSDLAQGMRAQHIPSVTLIWETMEGFFEEIDGVVTTASGKLEEAIRARARRDQLRLHAPSEETPTD